MMSFFEASEHILLNLLSTFDHSIVSFSDNFLFKVIFL